MRDVRNLQGRVVLVAGAERGAGASVAIGLAARGASVVVAGSDERRLGEIVGEIAYGGGKARHAVARDDGEGRAMTGALTLGAERARGTFGGLDVVILVAPPESAGPDAPAELLRAAASPLSNDGVVIALGDHAAGDALSHASRDGARSMSERGITCNAVVRGPAFDDDRDEGALVDLVVFLTSASGHAVSGQTITVRA